MREPCEVILLTLQEFYTLRAHPERSGAMIRLHLDVLLEYVLSLIQPQEPHARLEDEVAYGIQPITYRGDTYRLYGRPDYILRYNDQDKLSVKPVVVRAKRLGFQCCSGDSRFSCCNPVQLLALMGKVPFLVAGITCANIVAMFHHRRKTHGETDCAVDGVATDSIDFWFYHIDDNSEVRLHLSQFDLAILTLQVSSVRLSAKVRPRFIEYQEITGLLGHIFTEAVNSSPKKTCRGPMKPDEYDLKMNLSMGTTTRKVDGVFTLGPG